MSAAGRLQVLCFVVGGRTFAVDIMGIREILRNQRVTSVPHTPPHLAGVVNLRGALIPVVDLHRVLLGHASRGGCEDPKLVVVHSRGKTAGLLVDQVLDVISVPLEALSPVPGASFDRGAVVVATFHRSDAEEEVVVLVRLAPLVEEEVLEAALVASSAFAARGPGDS